MLIDRGFIRLSEGLVHLRKIARPDAGFPPLFLLHASPCSSVEMESLMLALAEAGYPGDLIAPDTLGNGDSAAPVSDEPDIAYFADSLRRLAGAMGHLRINVMGVHTGARIACEFAAAFPEQTAHAVLDGITEYDAELRDSILAHYAPDIEPDEYGRHLIWAFNFIRDQTFHFPYFMRDPAHQLKTAMLSPDRLHSLTLDILKALKTYKKPYLAAFRYQARARFAAIARPTMLLVTPNLLPNLRAAATELAASTPWAKIVESESGNPAIARAILEFVTPEAGARNPA